MSRAVTQERRLKRARWVEAALTGLLALVIWLIHSRLDWLYRYPQITVAFLAVFAPLSLGLTFWQYRIMDEFQRARLVKAWAASGVSGLLTVTAMIVWGAFTWDGFGLPPALARTIPQVSFSVTDLYVPWVVMLATFGASVAYLYRRDTRG